MKQFSKLFAIAFIAFPFWVGCNYEKSPVEGNYQISMQQYTIEDFSAIQLDLDAEVVYRQYSDSAPYLQINTDENIIPHLNVRVVDHRLIIEAKPDSIISPTKLVIYTNSKALDQVEVSGAGQIRLLGEVNSRSMDMKIDGTGIIATDSLLCEQLKIDIVGQGSAKLKGAAINSTFSINGSGDIDASEYFVENPETTISGNGNIRMWSLPTL